MMLCMAGISDPVRRHPLTSAMPYKEFNFQPCDKVVSLATFSIPRSSQCGDRVVTTL